MAEKTDKQKIKTPLTESLPGVDDKPLATEVSAPVTEAGTGAVVPPIIDADGKIIIFWAIERNASLVVTLRNSEGKLYDHSIQFNSNQFPTSNPALISAIRSNAAFNVRIFEGAYPPEIRRKIDKQREGLTKDASAIGDTLSERYPV